MSPLVSGLFRASEHSLIVVVTVLVDLAAVATLVLLIALVILTILIANDVLLISLVVRLVHFQKRLDSSLIFALVFGLAVYVLIELGNHIKDFGFADNRDAGVVVLVAALTFVGFHELCFDELPTLTIGLAVHGTL